MIIKRDAVAPSAFGGLQVHDYTAGHDTSSSFAVVVVPPGAGHPEAYSQRSDKYYYVLSGRIHLTLDAKVWQLEAGDLCVVSVGQRFRYENRESGPATLALIHTPVFLLEAEIFTDQS